MRCKRWDAKDEMQSMRCIWEMQIIRWIELNEKKNINKCIEEDVYNAMQRMRWKQTRCVGLEA